MSQQQPKLSIFKIFDLFADGNKNPEIFDEYTVQDTHIFLHCDENTFIQKTVSIARHLVHKCGKSLHDA